MTEPDPTFPAVETEPVGFDPAARGDGAAQTDPGEADPGTQAELDLGMVSTGDSRVDAALTGLESLAALPVSEHPPVFDGVHHGLHTALTELDED